MKYAKENKSKSILVNLSGRGDKDIDFIIENFPMKLKVLAYAKTFLNASTIAIFSNSFILVSKVSAVSFLS